MDIKYISFKELKDSYFKGFLVNNFYCISRMDYLNKMHCLSGILRIVIFFFFNRNPLYATRATLVSTEALKSRKMYNEAALQFIKLTSEVGCHIIQTLLLDTSLLIFATSECFNSRRGRSIKFRTYVQCSCTCTCMLVQKKYVQIIVYKFCLYRIQIYGVLFSWNKLLIATSIWRFLRSGSTPST